MKKKTPKLTNKVRNWLDKIQRASKVRDNWRKKFRVDLAYQYFEGVQRPDNVPANEWITLNLTYSSLLAELPALYSQDPYFYVKVRKSYNPGMSIAEIERKAKVRQSMLNYLKSELNLKQKSRVSIFDAHFQYGICKVAFEVDFVDNPYAGRPMISNTGEMIIGQDGIIIVEPDKLPTNERYIVTRVHPDDFVVDEDADPLGYDWCAHKIRRKLDDVKVDKKYSASVRANIKATEISDEDKERESRKKGTEVQGPMTKDDAIPDIVVIWEVWDRKNKQFFTVSEGCNEYLEAPQDYPPGIEDDPFVDLRFVLRDDSWYPLPPVSQWLDSQREYCETRSKILQHRKRFNRKYEAYAPGFDDPEQAAAKLEAGEDGTVLLKNQPQTCISPISDAPLDMQVHTELAYLRQDFQDLAIGANQRGGGSGIDSATEAGIVEKRTLIREGDKQSIVADFLAGIGRKLDMLVQANLTSDMAIKVAGPEGEAWVNVSPMDYDGITGEYQTTVVAGSHTPQLPEIERAQALNFMSLVAQAPQVAMSGSLMKWLGGLFNIEESRLDMMINELQQVFQMIQQQQIMQKTGGVGSLPGVPESREQSAGPGAALGINNIRGGMQ